MVTKILDPKNAIFLNSEKPTRSESFDIFWKWLLGNKKPKMETKKQQKVAKVAEMILSSQNGKTKRKNKNTS